MKESSWEGIQEMYEKGEISEEQMNNFIAIRNLSYKEWKQVKKDYLAGTISKEQYEQLKQIKEMPDDWTTMENGIKGILYGAGSGVWEGLQWYVGGKIATMAVSSSNIANSAARISADTVMNSADTPYRTILNSLISGDSLEDSWNENGGWKSLLMNAGIGLIGSAGSEVAGNVKAAKNIAKQERITEEVNNLINVINTGRASSAEMVDLIRDCFEKWLKQDNPYAEKLLNKIIEIKQNIPEYRWRSIRTNDAYNAFAEQELVMGDMHIRGIRDAHTYAHETGHQLFSYLRERFPDKWNEIVTRAQKIATSKNSNELKKIIKELQETFYEINLSWDNEYYNYLKSKGYYVSEQNIEKYAKEIENYIIDNNITIRDYLVMSGYQEQDINKWIGNGMSYGDVARMRLNEEMTNQYIDDLAKDVENYMVNNKYTVSEYLEEIGFKDEEINALIGTNMQITYRDIAITKIHHEVSTIIEEIQRKQYGNKIAISNFIASLFKCSNLKIKEEVIEIPCSHGEKYYNSWEFYPIHELIADFTALKMNGNNKELKQIKKIFGSELYNTMDELFKEIIN